MNTLVIAVILKASLLIGAALAVNSLLLRRRSAAARHLVWTLALGGILVLPVLSITVPRWGIPVHLSAAIPEAAMTPLAAEDESEPAIVAGTAAAPKGRSVDQAAGSLSATELLGETLRTNVALALYAAGVLLLGLRLAIGRWTLGRIVRQSAEVVDPSWRELLRACKSRIGIGYPVRLLRSLDRSMPMAFGLRTPIILIPAIADTWSEDRRRAVLLHELAHIDRRDCFTQLLAEVSCAAYWMHPAVWLVAQRLRVERELACDDRVLSVGTAARDYASHLLELAYSLGGYRSPALVVSMARPRQLEGRMLAVLDAARNRVTPTLRARVIGSVATMALVLPLAAAEAVMVSDSSTIPGMIEWSAPVSPEESQASTPTSPATPPSPDERADRGREILLPGTWEVRPSKDDAGRVHLRLSDRPNSTHGFTIALDELDGLSPSLLTGGGGPAKFNIRREAGTIVLDGVFRSGLGAGTFDFMPSQTFGAEMAKRGFPAPTTTEQYQLARGNIGFAYLDELNAQKYERPSLADLVRAADHGVHLDYLRGMAGAGYRLGRIDALVRTRDHGVTPAYIRGLADEGLKDLSAEQLVRARDHGVTPDYAGGMRAFGYRDLPIEGLIRARDHGVSVEFLRGMAEAGHAQLALDELVRARDHGVSPEYARGMREAGHPGLSLDQLVSARDHGVGAEFAKEWRDLGYRPELDELIRARDHGVNPEFAGALQTLGYERLSIDELVRLRDHGVSAAFVRDQNSGRSGRLTVDELVRRRDRGM